MKKTNLLLITGLALGSTNAFATQTLSSLNARFTVTSGSCVVPSLASGKIVQVANTATSILIGAAEPSQKVIDCRIDDNGSNNCGGLWGDLPTDSLIVQKAGYSEDQMAYTFLQTIVARDKDVPDEQREVLRVQLGLDGHITISNTLGFCSLAPAN